MKRNFVSFIVALVLAAIAMPALAQDKITIQASDQLTVRDIVKTLADTAKVKIVFDDPKDAALGRTWSGELDVSSLYDGLDAVLGTSGLEAVPGRVIHIRRLQEEADPAISEQAPPSRPQAQQVAVTQAPNYAVAQPFPTQPGMPQCAYNMYTVPAVYSPSIGISQAEWVLARNRMPCEIQTLPAFPLTDNSPVVGYQPVSYPYPQVGYQQYPNAAAYNSGYYGYNSGYNMWPWMKGCANGPAGYIKFKYLGKSAERHLWNIYLNGEIVGSLDQGDSFFNRIEVCAGHNVVIAEKLGWGPGKARNERPYSVRPWTLTEITVGDFLFEKDSHQELRNRVLSDK